MCVTSYAQNYYSIEGKVWNTTSPGLDCRTTMNVLRTHTTLSVFMYNALFASLAAVCSIIYSQSYFSFKQLASNDFSHSLRHYTKHEISIFSKKNTFFTGKAKMWTEEDKQCFTGWRRQTMLYRVTKTNNALRQFFIHTCFFQAIFIFNFLPFAFPCCSHCVNSFVPSKVWYCRMPGGVWHCRKCRIKIK